MGPDKQKKSCFNCTKRRIKCDQTEPQCNKCLKKGLICTGYGIRYRFADGKTAPTPGPDPDLDEGGQQSESSKLPGKQHRRQRHLKWVDVSSQLKYDYEKKDDEADNINNNPHLPDACQDESDVIAIERDDDDFNWGQPSQGFDFNPMPISTTSLRPLLSSPDPRIRLLFNHFARHVSPVMLMYDDEANGYRHQVLPLAHGDPVVERAVCIAAAFHLSQKSMPELRLPAETGRAAIISKLSSQTAAADLSDSTWATIILLIVADLVTGHEQVMTLCKMLVAFMEARGQQSNISTPLGEFLYYQSRLISFFAHPMLSESKAITDFSQVLSEPVDDSGIEPQYAPFRHQQLQNLATSSTASSPLTSARTQLYVDIIRQATEIYLLRAQASSSTEDPPPAGVDPLRMPARVTHMHSLFDRVDPGAPGAHTLVWPGFVAAAEAREEDDRQFFSAVLRRIWETTGYANVRRGLDALPGIWARQGSQQRWTAALPELRTVVM